MKKVRWGVIGAGRIAHTFCSDTEYTDNAEVVAVGSRNLAMARTFAAQYQIPKAYGHYQDLFDDPDIDAVYVATPHNFHFPQCQMALESGKHVLCEKPFTVSSEECQQLMDLAGHQQRFLMEGIWTYFLPAIKQAKAWFDEGRIGSLVQLKADFGYPIEYDPKTREYNTELHGGCLLEMGIYPLAFAQLFLGREPEHLSVSGSRAPNGVEDDLCILAEYPDVSVQLATSFKARLPNWGFVIGTEGYIAVPDFFRASQCSLHKLDEQIELFVDERQGSGFEFQIQAASNHILKGDLQSPVIPLSTSLSLQQQMETILAIANES